MKRLLSLAIAAAFSAPSQFAVIHAASSLPAAVGSRKTPRTFSGVAAARREKKKRRAARK